MHTKSLTHLTMREVNNYYVLNDWFFDVVCLDSSFDVPPNMKMRGYNLITSHYTRIHNK